MKEMFKSVLFGFLICFLFVGVCELFCFLILSYYIKLDNDNLTKKFPAQFRMSKQEIFKEFPNNSPIEKVGQFLMFDFDPVMGFRKLDCLRWFGGTIDDVHSKFLIVTFGGSTTQLDNWPKYLIKYAKEESVKQDIIVLNAGLAGNMSFNEKIYFSSWIMPMLEKKGKKPDLILSLDGDNDIWFRIFSYLEYKNMKSDIWYKHYHAYSQIHDTDMRRIRSTKGILKQLIANLFSDTFSLSKRVIPYTLRTLVYVLRKHQSNLKPQINKEGIKPEKIKLSDNIEDEIVGAYKESLLDFYSMAKVRDIDFIGYLQPVILDKYYPHKLSDFFYNKGINYMGLDKYRRSRYLSRMCINKVVETERLFSMSEKIYKDLNNKFSGSFENFISLFKNIPYAEKLYTRDAIHYNQLGKETIAHAVILDLLKKNILTK